MARCAKCGKMSGVPDRIPLKDMRNGSMKPVQTTASLVGNRPSLKNEMGMNQQKLSVKNPLNGKK